MTATAEKSAPELALCRMTAPANVIERFLEEHGEKNYKFGFKTPGDTNRVSALLLEGLRIAEANDTLVWRRGGNRVLTAGPSQEVHIRAHAVALGLREETSDDGGVIVYRPNDREIVIDAVPIENMTASMMWAARHPDHVISADYQKDYKGHRNPVVVVNGKAYERGYWLVWTRAKGVINPQTDAEWRKYKRDKIKNNVAFRAVPGGGWLGFKRTGKEYQ